MFPVIHCLWVWPCLIDGVTIFHASSRCFRWTAVRMKRPATTFASFETGADLSGLTIVGCFTGGAADGVSGFAVFVPKCTIVKATIPATRISAESHGTSRFIRWALFRAAGVVLIAPRLDAISVEELEDRSLPPDAPHLAERVAHLAHGHVRSPGLDDRRHEVRIALGGGLERSERGLDRRAVAARAQGSDALDLLLLERRVDAQDVELRLVVELVAVDADDDPTFSLDLSLIPERRLGDLALEEVLLDRGHDPSERADPAEVVVGFSLEPVGQVLQVPGAAERVDGVHHPRLVRDHLLRPEREPDGVLGGERERLVERVRVQGLRAAEHSRERLEGG